MPYVHLSVFTDGYMSTSPDVLKMRCSSPCSASSWASSGASQLAGASSWSSRSSGSRRARRSREHQRLGRTIVKSVYHATVATPCSSSASSTARPIPSAVLTAYEESTFGRCRAPRTATRSCSTSATPSPSSARPSRRWSTPYEIFKSMTKTQHRMAAGLVAAGAAAQSPRRSPTSARGPRHGRRRGHPRHGPRALRDDLPQRLPHQLDGLTQIEAGDLAFLNLAFKKGILHLPRPLRRRGCRQAVPATSPTACGARRRRRDAPRAHPSRRDAATPRAPTGRAPSAAWASPALRRRHGRHGPLGVTYEVAISGFYWICVKLPWR